MTQERKFSQLFYNAWTYLGVLISLLVGVLEAFLFAISFYSGENVYLGIITYLILPVFLAIGLLLIPIGVLWKRSRLRRGLPEYELKPIRIDLALRTHRNALLVFIIGTALLVLMSLIGSYQAFHYTESVAFCGTLCHSVMHPEHTTYLKSPHGRVKCVECHIGPGAGWFVRSKLSGVRQVFAVFRKTYHKPIKTPIHDLRPAEETCSQCHWPGKFFGAVDLRRAYYLSDSGSNPWRLRMLLQVGAGGPQLYGIHAHMNVGNDVYYAADDAKREKISWVRSVDSAGKETIYTSPDSRYKEKNPPSEAIRRMDCIDCHNRPSHQFEPPFKLVNEAMFSGKINPAIPGIKEKAVEALAKKYESNEQGRRQVQESLTTFFKEEEADYYSEHQSDVDRSIAHVVQLFSSNIFPDMKARWDSFPDNIGHMYFLGCARCHDGEHSTREGKQITRDCNSCHVIVEQGWAGKEKKNLGGMEFEHPDGSDDWKDTLCSDCHTGGLDS